MREKGSMKSREENSNLKMIDLALLLLMILSHTRQNPKRYIPLVSLLLWCEMVAVHCFVWPPALRL